MTPIDHSVAELLHHLALAKRNSDGIYGHINVAMTRPDLLEFVARSDELGLTEHLGVGLDWPYMRLSPKGTEVVNEAIAAMREVV